MTKQTNHLRRKSADEIKSLASIDVAAIICVNTASSTLSFLYGYANKRRFAIFNRFRRWNCTIFRCGRRERSVDDCIICKYLLRHRKKKSHIDDILSYWWAVKMHHCTRMHETNDRKQRASDVNYDVECQAFRVIFMIQFSRDVLLNCTTAIGVLGTKVCEKEKRIQQVITPLRCLMDLLTLSCFSTLQLTRY